MQVYDYDTAADDIVGSISFDVVDILKKARKNEGSPWFWKGIYGAPLGVSGEHTNEMNRVPEIASSWKGRILMQIAAEKTDKPEMRIKPVAEEVMQDAANSGMFNTTRYEIKAEIRQGICLPHKKFKVKLKIGNFECKTKSPKKYGNGFSYWNYTFDEQIWDCPYHTLEDMSDVFLYLMDGDDPV